MPAPDAAAYEHNGQPCTRQQFYAIACDPHRHVAVQACAGAGKTWMLVSRILRALLLGAEPQEILAITFTKKAAGEMRARLNEWLLDFARPRPAESQSQWHARLDAELLARGIQTHDLPDARQRLRHLHEALLGYGRSVQIRTFHSWFAALLRNAPLAVLQQLGLPPEHELLEKDDDAVAEVWRRYLHRVAADADLSADYTALVRQTGRTHAEQALRTALGRRVEFTLADAAGKVQNAVPTFNTLYPPLAAFDAPAHALLHPDTRQRWQHWAKALAAEKNKTPQKAANAIIDALAHAEHNPEEALNQLRAALFVKSEDRLNHNLASIGAAQEAEPHLQTLAAAQRQHKARQYHLRITRLTRPLIEEYAALKRQRGWVDMSDVEQAALTLLSDPFLSGWVQQRLDARVRHLLIDEFQDTNPLQWQALYAWLSAYAGAGGGKEGPSIFIVGDPKQSIYRFRRAEPRVFEAAQDFIVRHMQGEQLACDHTRRNTPAVLAAVNTVMQQAQDAGQFQGFRPHTTESADAGEVRALPLIPRPARSAQNAAEQKEQAHPAWRDSLTTPRTSLEDTLRTLESRQAARWIAQRLADGLPPGQLMVLARKRIPLSALQAELRQLGIACDQPEAQRLADQPAAQDVLALVQALLSPTHNLALAQALKSPMFGLQDEDLIAIARTVRAAPDAGHSARPSWLDALPRAPLPHGDGAALHADLLRYRQWLHTLPPHDALQAIFHHRDALARFAAAAPAPERPHVIAHLQGLLAAALRVQGGRRLTAYQWLLALRNESITAPHAPAQGSVRLLTVHGAKGLEADEVLLLDTASAAPGGRGPTVLMQWPAGQSAPTCLAFVSKASEPPPSLESLAAEEAQADAREELNALYVAMTRARRRLLISGITPGRSNPGNWWDRLLPTAQPLESLDNGHHATATPAHAPFTLPELPPALPEAAPAATAGPQPASDTAATRLGEAMHWLLEHAGDTPRGWLPQRHAQIAQRFALDPEQTRQAEAMARRILQGEAAWAWQTGDGGQVTQAFNEVELTHQGQRLRIDRLVCRRAQANAPESWWVLDYKSAPHPERDPQLQTQLAQYRSAVQNLHPGKPVHAAFLTAEGKMKVLDPAHP